MAHYDLKTEQLKEMAPKLRAGDTVTLTGTVYTARDAAHKKIVAAMDAGDKLPFDLDGDLLRRPDPRKAGSGHRLGRPDHLRPYGPVRTASARCRSCLHDRQGRAGSGRAGRNGTQRRGLYGGHRRCRRGEGGIH